MNGPRIGSLFSGTGALDMAARDVLGGGEVVWHCDIKPAAVALLAHRYPGVPNLGDLLAAFPVDTSADLFDEHGEPLDDLDPARWLPVIADVPSADVVTFGWPCQPHSSAGKRLGEADPRALLRNVLRAVGHLRPRILFGENVARVATNGELRRAVRALAALGYVGAWRCLPAADVGAPHKRDRVALVAVRADAAADTLGVLHGEVAEGAHSLDGERAPYGGRELLAAGPGRGGRAAGGSAPGEPAGGRRTAPGDAEDRAVAAEVTLLPTPSASNYGTNQGGAAGRVGPVRESLDTMARRGRFDGALLPTPTRTDGQGGIRAVPERRTHDGKDHGPRLRDVGAMLDAGQWGVYAAAVARWEQVLGRPAPAPTQPSARTGGPQLAPAFVEWMMGLPAGWVTDVPDLAPRPPGHRNAALSLLGDGVVPQQLAHGYRLALADLAGRLAVERAA